MQPASDYDWTMLIVISLPLDTGRARLRLNNDCKQLQDEDRQHDDYDIVLPSDTFKPELRKATTAELY